MNSPFPGMDPYLEWYWGDVHQSIITYSRDDLQERLPDDLRARMQDRVLVESPDPAVQAYYPDIRVIERPGRRPSREADDAGGVAVAEPLVMDYEVAPIRLGYIEIIDVKSGRKVVTTIEVLSPVNKHPGEGLDRFVSKQVELRQAGVNTVEIDLLRDGRRVLAVGPDKLPPEWRTAYQACVWRATRPQSIEVYRIPLRERLPVIRIPLRPADADVTLDLQAVIDRAYRNGGYDDIDYRAEPKPPLAPGDAAWADALLRAQGRR